VSGWPDERRARIGYSTFERYAEGVRAFPERHHPLRVARTAAGLAQVDLAALSHITSATISRIERGIIKGQPATQKALAAALGKPRNELFHA
jgi:DNA-binding XRE family transcriptional regulator